MDCLRASMQLFDLQPRESLPPPNSPTVFPVAKQVPSSEPDQKSGECSNETKFIETNYSGLHS
jgi:hypothetical protein